MIVTMLSEVLNETWKEAIMTEEEPFPALSLQKLLPNFRKAYTKHSFQAVSVNSPFSKQYYFSFQCVFKHAGVQSMLLASSGYLKVFFFVSRTVSHGVRVRHYSSMLVSYLSSGWGLTRSDSQSINLARSACCTIRVVYKSCDPTVPSSSLSPMLMCR